MYFMNTNGIEDTLLKCGAVQVSEVFRIDSVQVLSKSSIRILGKFLNYIDGNSPRTKVDRLCLYFTEYDATQKLLCTTNVDSASGLNKFFYCLQPALIGEKTLIGWTVARILAKMSKTSVSGKIEHGNYIYIRNLHGGAGVGPSWKDTFELMTNKTEEYCNLRHQL